MQDIILDAIDLKLIRELVKNSRAKYSDLAELVHLSDVAVRRRIDRLLNKGVIQSFTAQLDLSKMGYDKAYLLFLRTELNKLRQIESALKKNARIVKIQRVMGEYNLLLKVYLRNGESLDVFLASISKIPGLVSLRGLEILSTVKYEDTLTLLSDLPVRL